VQAAELAAGAKELKKDGDVYAGDLTEAAAKNLLRFRTGGDGPTVSNAKGSVKFWLKEGGSRNTNSRSKATWTSTATTSRWTARPTVEIKDVGHDESDGADEAKKKLS
jgi:hypothetical protein